MKKLLLLFALLASATAYPCADYEPEAYYYSLFMQETIGDPQYFPFLLTYESAYYESDKNLKNENIEEWQSYLNIRYEDAYYLVFKAQKSDVNKLIQGVQVQNDTLKFATPAFAKKHIQALKYIAYAKYLEPYVYRDKSYYWYYNQPKDMPDYNEVLNVLQRSWAAETDKELKLRYGYQLVRWAHYNKRYEAAIDFFNSRVASLNYRPAMYYYALDQKAGAERGLGNLTQARNDFFTVFNHTKNIKAAVYNSLRFCNEVEKLNNDYYEDYTFSEPFFEKLLKQAKTDDEKNNVYLFLGYQAFNSPVSAMEKIITNTPDAVQARVLMARAVNELEREYLPIYPEFRIGNGTNDDEIETEPQSNNANIIVTIHSERDSKQVVQPKKSGFWSAIVDFFRNLFAKAKTIFSTDTPAEATFSENRLPFAKDENIKKQAKELLQLAEKQLKNNEVKNKDFWNYTAACICFLQRDYPQSKTFLQQVEAKDAGYKQQKAQLEVLIAICEQPTITPEFEKKLFSDYKALFDGHFGNDAHSQNTVSFLVDVLANRYFLQKEYAKAFLLHHSVTDLKSNPDDDLIDAIETLYHKKDKSPMEQHLAENMKKQVADFGEYIAFLRGNVFLARADFDRALQCFQKVSDTFKLFDADYYNKYYLDYSLKPTDYNGYANIPNLIFGYNRIESFDSPEKEVMSVDYLSDFQYIKPLMNKRELAEALVQLQKASQGKDELSAKANYLIGNFLYNVTSTGYYRHILRFDQSNGNCAKFYDNNTERKIYEGIYFSKNFDWTYYYPDNLTSTDDYLNQAMTFAQDDELKARIAFALSKVEQEDFYLEKNFLRYSRYGEDPILIKDRAYFKELSRYAHTQFYEEVKTNCLYFNYYVENYR